MILQPEMCQYTPLVTFSPEAAVPKDLDFGNSKRTIAWAKPYKAVDRPSGCGVQRMTTLVLFIV